MSRLAFAKPTRKKSLKSALSAGKKKKRKRKSEKDKLHDECIKLTREATRRIWGNNCAFLGYLDPRNGQPHQCKTNILQMAHYFGQAACPAVKYDLDNTALVCSHLHAWGHARGEEYLRQVIFDRIGPDRFEALYRRAYLKRDYDIETLEQIKRDLS